MEVFVFNLASSIKICTDHMDLLWCFCLFHLWYHRSDRWVQSTRRSDLLNKSPKYLHNNCRICSMHFEPSQILCTGRLVWNAVPTIFNIPNPPKKVTLKRKLPSRHVSIKRSKKSKTGTVLLNLLSWNILTFFFSKGVNYVCKVKFTYGKNWCWQNLKMIGW